MNKYKITKSNSTIKIINFPIIITIKNKKCHRKINLKLKTYKARK